MELFKAIKEMGHEHVLFCHDKKSEMKAIIALHDTGLGSAMGATRLWPYISEEDALQDVLRLSRGMTGRECLRMLLAKYFFTFENPTNAPSEQSFKESGMMLINKHLPSPAVKEELSDSTASHRPHTF